MFALSDHQIIFGSYSRHIGAKVVFGLPGISDIFFSRFAAGERNFTEFYDLVNTVAVKHQTDISADDIKIFGIDSVAFFAAAADGIGYVRSEFEIFAVFAGVYIHCIDIDIGYSHSTHGKRFYRMSSAEVEHDIRIIRIFFVRSLFAFDQFAVGQRSS